MIKQALNNTYVRWFFGAIIFIAPWFIWSTVSIISNNSFREQYTERIEKLHEAIEELAKTIHEIPPTRIGTIETELKQNNKDHTSIMLGQTVIKTNQERIQQDISDIKKLLKDTK